MKNEAVGLTSRTGIDCVPSPGDTLTLTHTYSGLSFQLLLVMHDEVGVQIHVYK